MDDPPVQKKASPRISAKLAKSRYKYSILRRHLTAQAATEGQDLRPWMKEAALWYIQQPVTPKPKQLAEKCTEFSKQPIREKHAKQLLRNTAWVAFVKQLDEEFTTRARALAETRMPKAIEAHFDAIDELFQAGKFEHIAKFTVPLLNRVWPEDHGPTAPAQIINIHLGGPESFAAKNLKLSQAVDITGAVEVTDG